MTSAIEKRRSLHLELQEQKAKNEKLTEELNNAASLAGMGMATAMIAHEINNLLTPLGSYASLALKYPDDRELIEKALSQTYENCKKASEVVSAILSVANVKSQAKKHVGLKKLIAEVFSCICRDFSKDNIHVTIAISDDFTIYAESAKLQQVMMNLIINARQAMLEKGGTLIIKAKKNNGYVTIEVRDSGVGIKPAYINSIFEPFFSTKLDRGDNNSKSGTGLGLYLCKKVVEEHNGTISVESEPNIGSTFIITLPDA